MESNRFINQMMRESKLSVEKFITNMQINFKNIYHRVYMSKNTLLLKEFFSLHHKSQDKYFMHFFYIKIMILERKFSEKHSYKKSNKWKLMKNI